MNRATFLKSIEIFVARSSIGASTVRGQGSGVAAAAREYLSSITLSQFSTTNPRQFQARLEGATIGLVRALPRQSRSCGISRKVVNIFLRNALYSAHLAQHYRLADAEALFELPLDSVCVSYLRGESERGALPRWRGVKHLTPEASAVYQDCTSVVARRLRVARVHMDAVWWGGRPDRHAA